MKETEWKKKKNWKKQKKFRKFKHLKEVEKVQVEDTPEQFKEIYKEVTGPEAKKGNALKKPNRFNRELKEKERLEQIQEENEKIRAERLKMQKLKEQKKKKTARMLREINKKGQPRLKNTLIHLVEKLKAKHSEVR